MKYVLYMHGGSGNHGCEALVRTTSKLIRNDKASKILLWSGAKEEDFKYGVNNLVDKIISEDELDKSSLTSYLAIFKHKFLKKKNAIHNTFLKKVFKDSVAISIGGDNYCYPWSAKQGVELDKEVRKFCNKNVFWGCSIEEDFLTDEVVNDLKGFDLITVRESFSYDNLKKYGISAELVSDPAFLLDEVQLPLPDGFIEDNTVGINISPLLNKYESSNNSAYKNYEKLIEFIIEKTDMNICLIPHVIWSTNNDIDTINEFYEKYKLTKRVVLIEDCNCEELKGYISRCRFFIGARTHSTIAAYSTCVPTLVVGYSIKSKGIAKDLFGTYEGYVVPVQEMKTEDELVERFKYIVENENRIRNYLVLIMPEYKKKAIYGGELLNNLK